jgi:hypothetical protein
MHHFVGLAHKTITGTVFRRNSTLPALTAERGGLILKKAEEMNFVVLPWLFALATTLHNAEEAWLLPA